MTSGVSYNRTFLKRGIQNIKLAFGAKIRIDYKHSGISYKRVSYIRDPLYNE